jgi:hypothetical protein
MTKNPQSNAIYILHYKRFSDDNLLLKSSTECGYSKLVVESVLASASYTSHMAVHHTLGISHGALIFDCDMLLPIPILHDYNLFCEHHQMLIDRNAATQNHRPYFKDYTVGNEVLIRVPSPAAGLDHEALDLSRLHKSM